MKILLKVKQVRRITNIFETKRLLLRNEVHLSDTLILTFFNNHTFTCSNFICELESDFTQRMKSDLQIPSNTYSLYQNEIGYNLTVICDYGYKGCDGLRFKIDDLGLDFIAEYESHDNFLRDLKLLQETGVLQQ